MRKAILVLAVIAGVAAVFSGLAAGGVALFGILVSSDLATFDLLASGLAFGAAAAGMGLGMVLIWHGWRALMDRPGAAFSLPRWGWWLLAFALVLLAGRWLISVRIDFFVPAVHALAAVIPPLLYLALAVGAARKGLSSLRLRSDPSTPPRLRRASAQDAPVGDIEQREGRPHALRTESKDQAIIPARSTWGSLAWGGLGGVGLGLLIEGLLLLSLLVVVSVVLSEFRPDLLAQLEESLIEMQRSGEMPDMDALRWLFSPLVILGVLLFASGLVPLVEEVAKSLAVPLIGLTGRRLTRLDGFLFGVAAGAGFALVEGIFNGALGLAQPEGWAGAMLARGGAAAMHCLASGLFGLGWQMLIVERRIGRAVGLAVLSVALHGLWNAGALATGLSGVLRPTVGFGALGLRDAQAVFIAGFLVVLWLLAVATLVWLPQQLSTERLAEE